MDLHSADQMLREKYIRLWPNLVQNLAPFVTGDRPVSYPQLISLTAHGYNRARVRLMVIGQQTRGWRGIWKETEGFVGRHVGPQLNKDPAGQVERIIERYREFRLGAEDESLPFFGTARCLFERLNPHGPPDGFLWTTLVKVDENGKRPDQDVEHAVFSAFNVLPVEIGCAHPDVVVFFTGPKYDDRLLKTFPGAVIEETEASPLVDRISHGRLPAHAYRTYHPRYLRMKKAVDRLVDAIGGWTGPAL